MSSFSLKVVALIRGYHVYRELWEPNIGKSLSFQRENGMLHLLARNCTYFEVLLICSAYVLASVCFQTIHTIIFRWLQLAMKAMRLLAIFQKKSLACVHYSWIMVVQLKELSQVAEDTVEKLEGWKSLVSSLLLASRRRPPNYIN